jgi:steroid delta-isomerase-like uncharacterized protein
MIRKGLLALTLLGFVGSTLADAQAQDNLTLCKRFYNEVATQGNIDLIDELVAENFLEHEGFPGLTKDRDGLKQFFTMMRTAFPDLKFDVEFMLSDGDKVAAYITMSGTQKGEFMGMPASGKKFTIKTIDIVRIVDGRAVEHWGVTDAMTMMQQLGVGPQD